MKVLMVNDLEFVSEGGDIPSTYDMGVIVGRAIRNAYNAVSSSASAKRHRDGCRVTPVDIRCP